MLDVLANLDRRWVFLAMFLAVAVPVLLRPMLPEEPTPIVRNVFQAVEELPAGSRIFFSLDYDPASQPELGPMTTSLVRHCCQKKHKLYFMTLWPYGPPMIEDAVGRVEREFGREYRYGEHYIDLGFNAGMEAAIKGIVTDLGKQFPLDKRGRPLDSYPVLERVVSLRDMDLVVSLSAGYPGTREWVQYASTPFPKEIRLVAGVTGVSAPPLYPYVPSQLLGMLPAIKGAAEYEAVLAEKYPQYADEEDQAGLARMGPQLVAHLLMIVLILGGNVIFLLERRRGASS